jgi:hypothetical protein
MAFWEMGWCGLGIPLKGWVFRLGFVYYVYHLGQAFQK